MPITDFEKVYAKEDDCPSSLDIFNDEAHSSEVSKVGNTKTIIVPIVDSTGFVTKSNDKDITEH